MSLPFSAAARAQDSNSLADALRATKPLVEARLAYEWVDQAPDTTFPVNANATTLRARLGAETGSAWGVVFLAEGEFLTPLNTQYRGDPSVPRKTQHPVVSDPEAYELNRAQVVYTGAPRTTITLGRQRISLDDQRFIGGVGWRQNEQTFDGLRAVIKPTAKLSVDAMYLNRINRIFGHDSPQGAYTGDFFLSNVAYQFAAGKLSGFAYVFDFDPIAPPALPAALNPARGSTRTLGARFAGDRPIGPIKLGYVASYAKQSDYGRNPLISAAAPNAMDNAYRLAEVSLGYRQFVVLLGQEALKGNGVAGFAAPLGTLHKFQGWVDKFLATPANGMDDRYISASASWKGVGPLDSLTAATVYHDFRSTRLAQDYGDELDLQVTGKWRRFTGVLKYGDYSESSALSPYRDTKKFWAQFEFAWR